MISYRHWLSSRLFRTYLAIFPLIWLLGKAANAFTAGYAGLPPLGFRPLPEIGACAIELFVLRAYLRRENQDILLANLGISIPAALAPLALVHLLLSIVLSLAA